MSNDDLIACAMGVLRPHIAKDRVFGDVGAALLSKAGHLYRGVAVDTPGWGLCAERSAIAAMITAGEYQIDRIVAVWRDDQSGKLLILPPCGICREFMRQVSEANLEAQVLLNQSTSITLA